MEEEPVILPSYKKKECLVEIIKNDKINSEIIGKGGSAEVYKVKQEWFSNLVNEHRELLHVNFQEKIYKSTGAPFVAVKVFNSTIDPYIKMIIANEISALQSFHVVCENVSVVCYIDYFTTSCEEYLIVMEYLTGMSLTQRLLHEKSSISELEISYIIFKLVQVIVFFHEHDIIHNDIKPDNIMISPDHGLKIIDMGFVCRIGDCIRKFTWAGTFLFLSRKKFIQWISIIQKDRILYVFRDAPEEEKRENIIEEIQKWGREQIETEKMLTSKDFKNADWWAFAITVEILLLIDNSKIYSLKTSPAEMKKFYDLGYTTVFGKIEQKDMKFPGRHGFFNQYILKILDNPKNPEKWPSADILYNKGAD